MSPGGRSTFASADFEATPAPDGFRYPEPGEVRWLMRLAERGIPGHRGSGPRPSRCRALRVMALFRALMAANCFFIEGA